SEAKTGGRFSANVNANSTNYLRRNTYNPTAQISAIFQSNINYNTAFRNTPFNLGVSLALDQNTATGVANVRLPVINFSMNRIYPFKKKVGSKNNFYENIFV